MNADEVRETDSQTSPSAEGPWYGECEAGHPIWTGPDRETYEAAQGDATAHDNAVHGGAPTAVVLN